MKLGIDVGSTTVKLVLLDEKDHPVYKRYERHMSKVFQKTKEMLEEFSRTYQGRYEVGITGSGGLSLAKKLGISFEQEVVACSEAVERLIPQTDTAIELGGEDAKITFYGESIEQRMNGTCAGGTGAFIDQMAVLLNTDAAGLNEAAKNYSIIYPIAARCGVFAKTDIQPLINEGAAREDLAASIFQAVADQTITGLACGRAITGKVTFLGGPLSFLSELRARFIETLGLLPEQVIFPEDSQYYPAMGAAFLAEQKEEFFVQELLSKMNEPWKEETVKAMEPLFGSKEEYEEFRSRHEKECVPKKSLETADGPVFLGIDAGSTTTKAALIDEDGNLLYTHYENNNGNPVESARGILIELYERLTNSAYIAHTVTTGYGEELIKAALKADSGEIETVAHYNGARAFLPDVDFILDIGGQDMKCIRIKNHAIDSIMLNEACSSGCGSFLETYARSIKMDLHEFAEMAVKAKHPVDLGSRCTVFMNSRVKQAQKEGAEAGDIAAGLACSVIRNALYKVMKLRDPDQLGKAVVVQGGTFLNDAVLRSFEKISGKNVIRPDIAGVMGAYGAALIGRKKYEREKQKNPEVKICSSILGARELKEFSMEISHRRCKGCQNSCQLTVNRFSDGNHYITGNRCEKGAGIQNREHDKLNLFRYKYHRLFAYKPLDENEAWRGTIGIPRVLNIHENYPFWFTLFTHLGFRVVLSPPSSKKIYEMGMETISSDTICYPAKLVHGHIKWLADQEVKTIFYPSISYERIEDKASDNHYNCPVVAMYPEVIAGNMDGIIKEKGILFLHPFLPYFDDRRMEERLYEELSRFGVSRNEIAQAYQVARAEDTAFQKEIEEKADEILAYIEKNDGHGIVLAGRPYHLDPEINHGIDKLIASYGFAVLTESSVAHLSRLQRPLRVLDQWMYHSRLYKAADVCGRRDDLDLIQLNSFGCGIDAVTTDETEEILVSHNKLYTVLKIDEGSNLGAARIRIRSLKAAIEERRENEIFHKEARPEKPRPVYTRQKKKEYTLLIPQMAPMQFDLMETAFLEAGYRAEVLPTADKDAVELGVKYINNDACYPTIVSLGQIISALQSGRYDLNRTAVLMAQTGGGCRASNYIALLRKALKEMGMEQIPVVSFNFNRKLEQNPGMKFTPAFGYGLLYAVMYGDLFMRLTNRIRPYEKVPGEAMELYRKWNEAARENVRNLNHRVFRENVRQIVKEFDELPIYEDMVKPKVGVVGEILVKYHPNANNDIVGIIEKEGGEAVVPDLLDFIMYTLKNMEFNYQKMAASKGKYLLGRMGMKVLYHYRKPVEDALRESRRFHPPHHIDKIAEKAELVTSLGTQCGEGWLLAGEMQELVDDGVDNIVCLQPFGCLPNHIVGKGMIKPIRELHPSANIAAIDYDPGASEVNQLNRIKLMMATAHKKLKNQRPAGKAKAGEREREELKFTLPEGKKIPAKAWI